MKSLFIGLIAAMFFASCGDGKSADSKVADTSASVPSEQDQSYMSPPGVDVKVSASLKSVFNSYLHLKNALAADNGREAAKAGGELLTALDKVDTTTMTAAQKASYNEELDDMREHAEHTTENADKIEHQRLHFKMLSDDIYELAKTFGGGRKLYYAHCPMAFDSKGAGWISEFKDIKNPYFGDQMLECGEVKEELK